MITRHSPQKNQLLLSGQGYSSRNPSTEYQTIVIHTTNGRIGTKFDNEVRYLLQSHEVSAHYVVSKSGEIVQILDPQHFVAWHTGKTAEARHGNLYAIGVEVHYTQGEGPWTGYMWDAITEIARLYPNCEVVTHRGVAVPKGRKIDPSGVSDYWFDFWKANRNRAYSLYTTKYRTNVREKSTTDSPIVTTLPEGFTVFSYDNDVVNGQTLNGSSSWRYVLGLGFIHEPLLSKIHTLE